MMHIVTNVLYSPQSWGFDLNGIKYFLTNPSRYIDETIRYKWSEPWGNENERFVLIGYGNLLKDDKISAHYIIQKTGSNDLFVMQVDSFKSQLEMIHE